MLEKLFGIIYRAYYLIVGIIALLCLGTAWDKYEYSQMQFGPNESINILMWQQQASQEFPYWILGSVCVFPIAFIIHKILHWVIWGKLR
jgi:hypothetical protein